MPIYVVARKSHLSSNEHEMHATGCTFVDNLETYAMVGVYDTTADALDAAEKMWPSIKIKVCKYCCHLQLVS